MGFDVNKANTVSKKKKEESPKKVIKSSEIMYEVFESLKNQKLYVVLGVPYNIITKKDMIIFREIHQQNKEDSQDRTLCIDADVFFNKMKQVKKFKALI